MVLLPYKSCVASAVMIYPSYEVHQVPLVPPFANTNYVPITNNLHQRSGTQALATRNTFLDKDENHPIGYTYYNEAANHLNNGRNADVIDDGFHHSRAADAEHPSNLYHRNSEYAYDRQSNYLAPPSDQVSELKDAASASKTPSTKISFQNPDLANLLKPITIKAASTSSGLMDLVMTFLTSSSTQNLEMKGFKDLVINGIIKPLLVAKGGIKTLISKLTIPLIALILINLEVLVTVWWLWEDCPQPKQQPPMYGYPNHPYNSYNTSYR